MRVSEGKGKMLEVVERIARVEVERNQNWWPPICSGILHQPKRPKKK